MSDIFIPLRESVSSLLPDVTGVRFMARASQLFLPVMIFGFFSLAQCSGFAQLVSGFLLEEIVTLHCRLDLCMGASEHLMWSSEQDVLMFVTITV